LEAQILRLQGYTVLEAENAAEALRLAESAVSVPLSTFYYADFKPEAAINLGYGNQPAGFYDIARMILDGASVADLKTKLKTIDQEIIKRGDFLFYSAERPDVTALLLDMGANANAANTQSYLGFGKTPLMYSAQYNQLETAKVLLKHGANSNAVTIKPPSLLLKQKTKKISGKRKVRRLWIGCSVIQLLMHLKRTQIFLMIKLRKLKNGCKHQALTTCHRK